MQTKNTFGRIFLIAMALAMVMTWGIAPAIASGDNRGNEDDQNQGTTTGGTERGTNGGTETKQGTGTMGGTQRGTTGDMSGMANQPRFLVVIPTSGKDDCQEALQDFSSALGKTGSIGGTYTQRDGGTATGRTNGEAEGSVSGRAGTNGGDVDVDVDTDKKTDMEKGTNGTTDRSKTGMGQTSSWQWGCNSDDKTIYLFTNATSETAALQHVPSEMRNDAKVIRLGQFGNTNIQSQPMKNPNQPRGTGSGSGSGTGGY